MGLIALLLLGLMYGKLNHYVIKHETNDFACTIDHTILDAVAPTTPEHLSLQITSQILQDLVTMALQSMTPHLH